MVRNAFFCSTMGASGLPMSSHLPTWVLPTVIIVLIIFSFSILVLGALPSQEKGTRLRACGQVSLSAGDSRKGRCNPLVGAVGAFNRLLSHVEGGVTEPTILKGQ